MTNIIYQSDMASALKMLFHGLRLLGIDLPEDPDEQKQEFLEDIKILNDKVGKLPHVSQLANLPDCKDPTQLHIFKLYVVNQTFEPKAQLIECKQVVNCVAQRVHVGHSIPRGHSLLTHRNSIDGAWSVCRIWQSYGHLRSSWARILLGLCVSQPTCKDWFEHS